MAEERKGAKKSHKHRKHGRQKRGSKNERQFARTEMNKRKRINRQRKLAGLPPITPAQFAVSRPLKARTK